ncbi:hypothetical protein EK904_006900 [Melospiza melodia maxima]|nr:hypothetical protein EK904_006900 [Melospiza melodia maxima]
MVVQLKGLFGFFASLERHLAMRGMQELKVEPDWFSKEVKKVRKQQGPAPALMIHSACEVLCAFFLLFVIYAILYQLAKSPKSIRQLSLLLSPCSLKLQAAFGIDSPLDFAVEWFSPKYNSERFGTEYVLWERKAWKYPPEKRLRSVAFSGAISKGASCVLPQTQRARQPSAVPRKAAFAKKAVSVMRIRDKCAQMLAADACDAQQLFSRTEEVFSFCMQPSEKFLFLSSFIPYFFLLFERIAMY